LFVRHAVVLGGDQFAQMEIALGMPSFMLGQVFVRFRSTDNARYGFHYNGDSGKDRWEIKYDGVPTAQTKILASINGISFSGGDRLRFRATGRDPVVLSAYVNDRLVLETQDNSAVRIGNGSVGAVSRRSMQTGFMTGDMQILDSFDAGTCP